MRIYQILVIIVIFKMHAFGDHLKKLCIDTQHTL